MPQKSVSALAVAACLALATQASGQTAQPGNAQNVPDSSEPQDIVVVGSGQTRSVSTLTPQNLEVLPPGSSVQKALNFLPGVMAQSIDALGVNEQSLSLQVRGFNTTHLGYTLDGMPLGDGAYNNYNGLSISRALISENLGRADLATGIAGLGIASTSNLGGALIYTSSDPRKDLGFSASQTFGSEDSLRSFVRLDTGEYGGFSAYVSGQYSRQDLFVNQRAIAAVRERRHPANVGHDDASRGVPQGMIRRQRLRIHHVEARTQAASSELGEQRVGVNHTTAGHVDE